MFEIHIFLKILDIKFSKIHSMFVLAESDWINPYSVSE